MSFRAWILTRRESGWHGFRNQPRVILSEAKNPCEVHGATHLAAFRQ